MKGRPGGTRTPGSLETRLILPIRFAIALFTGVEPHIINLGQMSYCPSGSQYSCSAVYSSYTYWVTETVPVVTKVSYETLSTLRSAWLIGG
ncbi:MAG: hypothetical protein JRN16_07975 [Nitrososphaerota archaeon]|nr:hypothetical protein [Nitrososphaerota archaeon]MDG6975497.1 hypothetical protein [Nitrososphaerota archaeon]MDG6980631.1 hypothetical protein [Nitrososphaerota archaeon]MDG7009896.1 hypothetical protein [Nitrososphaerota archaeon]MDG7028331.1 hypothetical protein [Nitrososphaerota archaeon]